MRATTVAVARLSVIDRCGGQRLGLAEGYCSGEGVDSEFGEHLDEVGLDNCQGEGQALGDLLVGRALGDLDQDLGFSAGQ